MLSHKSEELRAREDKATLPTTSPFTLAQSWRNPSRSLQALTTSASTKQAALVYYHHHLHLFASATAQRIVVAEVARGIIRSRHHAFFASAEGYMPAQESFHKRSHSGVGVLCCTLDPPGPPKVRANERSPHANKSPCRPSVSWLCDVTGCWRPAKASHQVETLCDHLPPSTTK
jgi:hypothetical protein